MNGFERWMNGVGLDPEDVVRAGIILLAGLLLGRLVGALVKHLLVSKGIDRYLHLPWTPAAPTPKGKSAQRKDDASVVSWAVAWLFTATVWAGSVWWIAWVHEAGSAARPGGRLTTDVIESILSGSWRIATMIFITILSGSWLARQVYDLFQMPWLKTELDAVFPDGAGTEGAFSEAAARLACTVVYVAFLIFAPVVAAGILGLEPLSGLVRPAWTFCARLFLAAISFAVSYLGLAWIRAESGRRPDESQKHSELEYYIGLGLMVATTLIALGVLTGISSAAGTVSMIIMLIIAGILLWPMRTQLRDLWAGAILRRQGFKTVALDGAQPELKAVGPMISTLAIDDEEFTRRNAVVLAEVLKAAWRPAVTGFGGWETTRP